MDGKLAALDSVDPTVVVVPLPSDLSPTAAVRLRFSGALPHDLLGYGIFARTPTTMTLSQFYPVLAPWRGGWLVYPTFPFGDNLVAEAADYTLDLVVPVGWVPIASGTETEYAPQRFRIVGENLRELALVLVKGYESSATAWDGVTLRLYCPPHLSFSVPQAFQVAAQSLTLFTEKLGGFPFAELDMVIVPLSGAAGVEYPGLILIGERYALDPGSDFFAEIVAHELAHQWWYGEVGTDQVAEPWVDEGLATYTSALYFAAHGRIEEKVREWRARYAQARRRNPKATVGSPLWEFPEGVGYAGYVYAGGALFLHEVRSLLGDEEFFSALQEFRERFRGKIARATDLLQLFANRACESFAPLVERYFGKALLLAPIRSCSPRKLRGVRAHPARARGFGAPPP